MTFPEESSGCGCDDHACDTHPFCGADTHGPASQRSPTMTEAWHLYDASELKQAEEVCLKALQEYDRDVDALHLLAIVAFDRGNLGGAVERIDQAAAIDPEFAPLYNSKGNILRAMGRLDEAETAYREALRLDPEMPEGHNNLGVLLRMKGRYQDSIASYRTALKLKPDFPEAKSNLERATSEFGRAFLLNARAKGSSPEDLHRRGMDALVNGDPRGALLFFAQALERKPDYTEAHKNYGNAQRALDQKEEAAAAYRRALEIDPTYVPALNNLGVTLRELGRKEEALPYLRDAVLLAPFDPEIHNNLGVVLHELGEWNEALDHFNQALAGNPHDAFANTNVAVTLNNLRRHEEAAEYCRAAVRCDPNSDKAWFNLGNSLGWLGDFAAAQEAYRESIRLNPGFQEAHSCLLFMLHFTPQVTPAEMREEYRRFEERFGRPRAAQRRPHTNRRDPGKRLRIGYVSSDFYDHATQHFIEPVLAAHDRNAFEIFCYDINGGRDGVTERLMPLADAWKRVAQLKVEELADMVRDDEIDILVDLKGHCDDNRLLAFAHKPAPVQATWLGYPNTTGLTAMDYWITDGHIASEEMTEQYHSERLVRLPDFYMCFRPSPQSPEVTPLPALTQGGVTFGSFNAFPKLQPETLKVWAQLLRQVPGSRLSMITVPESRRPWIQQIFAEAGVSADRLNLLPRLTHAEFLALHQTVDVALDPYPCVGTTTTLHSLWMGLPVVTLAGRSHASRVGVSIMENLGLPELVARDTDQYRAIAAELAGDLNRLAQLRSGLRERMRASPLTQEERFTRNLEAEFRKMWRAWCESEG